MLMPKRVNPMKNIFLPFMLFFAVLAGAANAAPLAMPQVIKSGTPQDANGDVLVDSSGVEKGTTANPIKVDGSAAVQPVSGSVSITGTLPAGTNNIGGVNLDNVADGATVTNSVTSASTIVSLNMAGYQGAGIHITSIGTGNTVTFEASNDNVTWFPVYCSPNPFNPSSAVVPTATTTGFWIFSAPAAYMRVRVSTYGSGTVTVSVTQKRVIQSNSPTSLTGGFNSSIGNVGVVYSSFNLGGAITSFLSAASTASTQITASSGKVTTFCLNNSAASLRSVKFFNNAAPTMGTTAALFEVDLPAGATVCSPAIEGGLYFSTAISVAVTSAKGLTDNTATGLAANDVSGFLFSA